jgi:hypothetical protein
LGIGTLLWVTSAPEGSPAVGPAVTAGGGADEPAVALPGPAAPDLGQGPAPTAEARIDEPRTDEPGTDTAPTVDLPAEPAPVVQPPDTPASGPPPVPAREAVLVLNNSRITGLAERAAASFARDGWPVRDTGNFTGRIRSTTVYYAPGQEADARAFAERFAGIARVLPRFEGLPGTGLTVVVTRDFA